MRTTAITPHISVSIGQQTRLYHAYITTAPAGHDAPSTITLYESTVADLAGFTFDSNSLDSFPPGASARLVLIDAFELTWQHARYSEAGHRLALPDDVLISLSTLQLWLWQRLKAPSLGDIDIARAS